MTSVNRPSNPVPAIRQTVTALDQALHEVEDRLQRLAVRAASLETVLDKAASTAERRFARGTFQGPALTEEDTKPAKRIRRGFALPDTVTREKGHTAAVNTDSARAKSTSDARHVPIGDKSSAAHVMLEVKRLLAIRPRTFAELTELTHVRHPRLQGALIQLQRDGVHLVNLGTPRRAIWALRK